MPDTGTNQPTTGGTTPMVAGGVSGVNPAMGGMPMANPMAPIGGVMGPARSGTGGLGMSGTTNGAGAVSDSGGTGVDDASSSVGVASDVNSVENNEVDDAIDSARVAGEGAMRDIPEEEKPVGQNREVLDKDVVVKPSTQAADLEIRDNEKQNLPEVQKTVIEQVKELHNVLIALSSNPSVDELAATIGITIYLDKIGKRATAIYSGETPNALEFLKPEDTFDHSADVLQDFVIALNKDKADHLRYKLDGDFVRIYITPYRAKITADDLEYSYGDYNVDLVLALDVANGVDLDEALREHGRIMHDAVVVDVTTGNPGKLGEIQWTDKNASSVSEMLAGMIYNMDGEPIGEDEATAFLTGIVAATNRFSSASTTPTTMEIASRLMQAGARHQLISKNITAEVNNELYQTSQGKKKVDAKVEDDGDKNKKDEDERIPDEEMSVREAEKENDKETETNEGDKKEQLAEETVNAEEPEEEKVEKIEPNVGPIDAVGPIGGGETVGPMDAVGPIGAEGTAGPVSITEQMDNAESMETVGPVESADSMETVGSVDTEAALAEEAGDSVGEETEQGETTSLEEKPEEDMSLLNDIKAAEESLKGAGAETVVEETKPMMIEGGEMVQEPIRESVQGLTQEPVQATAQELGQDTTTAKQEKVLEPSAELNEESAEGVNKYGQMLQDALNGVTSGNMPETYAAGVPNAPMMSGSETEMPGAVPTMGENIPEMPGAPMNETPVANGNVAETYAPAVPSAPEINGVPEMNYMPMPGDQVLPPPPAPPINMDAPLDANGLVMPGVSQMPGGAPVDTQMTGGMPMGSAAPMDNQVAMDASVNAQNTMSENYGASQSANGMASMATELPNVMMDGAEAGPAPVPAMEPVLNPMMGAATQPAVETAPVVDSVPAAESVQDAMASEPYDPSAFRIPGIK